MDTAVVNADVSIGENRNCIINTVSLLLLLFYFIFFFGGGGGNYLL